MKLVEKSIDYFSKSLLIDSKNHKAFHNRAVVKSLQNKYHEIKFKDMTSGTIRGRVKRHQTSNYHEGKETVLNYVKVMSNV